MIIPVSLKLDSQPSVLSQSSVLSISMRKPLHLHSRVWLCFVLNCEVDDQNAESFHLLFIEHCSSVLFSKVVRHAEKSDVKGYKKNSAEHLFLSSNFT